MSADDIHVRFDKLGDSIRSLVGERDVLVRDVNRLSADPPAAWLSRVCRALGWKGGAFVDALAEIERLREHVHVVAGTDSCAGCLRPVGSSRAVSVPNPKPIPMILNCPACHARHVDAGEFATKPHHTHACQSCGFVWCPALVPTVGVQFLPGFKDAS